jgi:N-acetylmuramoyl-L-alanine amidase
MTMPTRTRSGAHRGRRGRRAAAGAAALLLLLLPACAPAATVPTAGPAPGTPPPVRNDLPPIPPRTGPLALSVVHPPEDAAVAADSTFIFGDTGTGEATLTINGAPVEVAPNGAFLAFLPVPRDGVYRLEARAAGREATLTRRIRPRAASAPARDGDELAIAPGSVAPRTVITAVEGERVTVRFRGTPGGEARLVFPDGTTVPLVEHTSVERDEGYMQDRTVPPREFTEYAGTFTAGTPLYPEDRRVGIPTLVEHAGRIGTARVELARGPDTVSAPLELGLGVLQPGERRVAEAASARPDGMAIGTALPGGGTPYHWQFPNGTRFNVTGERGGELRVRLTDDLDVWVAADQVRLLPAGTPPVEGSVGGVRGAPAPEWVDLRLSTSERMPFEVTVDGRWLTVNVYGARSRTNWMYYGFEDPLVHRLTWGQVRDDLYYVRVELTEAVWGWQTFWDEGGALVVRIRRPPAIDARRPLAGLRIGIDAGHPPGGATGPTGLTEAEANLAISKELVRMLRDAGAEVLETRPDAAAVALGDRPQMATEAGVHLLVSVHNNAFPDGVNPFENAGTSTFYNQPQSMLFARHMQRELLREFGLRDVGIARADLALVRPTWMPSVLTETMFMMVPEQEAALRDPAVQRRIARAHVRGLEGFVREWVDDRQ